VARRKVNNATLRQHKPDATITNSENRRDVEKMTLTRSFKETVIARIASDTDFHDAMLSEGVECLLSGDVDTGKAVLR